MVALKRRSIEEIAAIMQREQTRNGKPAFVFLIGAGCSASAGIPTASGMVKELKERAYKDHNGHDAQDDNELESWMKKQHSWYQPGGDRWREREYYVVFENLLPTLEFQRQYIEECIRRAGNKLNWAHLLLADLIERCFVNAVFTTNFDDLLPRALFLLGSTTPIITDHPATVPRVQAGTSHPTLIYLHGTYLHYSLRNGQAEVAQLPPGFEGVMRQFLSSRGLIVVGYSGGEEYVIKRLAELAGKSLSYFAHNLYWVPYRSARNLTPRATALLKDFSRGYLVEDEGVEYEADSFFQKLHLALGLESPKLVTNPLTFVRGKLSLVSGLPPTGATKDLQTGKETDVSIKKVVGELDYIINHKEEILGRRSEGDQAGSLFAQGIREVEKGDLHKAAELFAAVTELKPDMHEAFYNWGIALEAFAAMKKGKGRSKNCSRRPRRNKRKPAKSRAKKIDQTLKTSSIFRLSHDSIIQSPWHLDRVGGERLALIKV